MSDKGVDFHSKYRRSINIFFRKIIIASIGRVLWLNRVYSS